MGYGIADTIAEAEAQRITIPKFEYWRDLARLMNGYKIAEELGLDFHAWGAAQEKNWERTQQWNLDVLHLRLMLFYIWRADYMTGWTYTEHDHFADSLLQELSKKLDQPYQPNKQG
jgi:hypothetical protein